MKYVLKYHPSVVREDIPSLDQGTRIRIKRELEAKLLSRPDLFGQPLRHSLKGHRKLRVGDYRVVYRVEKSIVIILGILHRSIVYSVVERRR